MSNKMLITGGAGFIGVNAADHFLKEGWEVTVLDNFSRKGTDINLAYLEENHSSGLTVVRADIRTDQDVLNKQCGQVDVVLHLAAQVAVTTSVTDPRTDFDCNALGTFNVLEAVRSTSNKPILIYASTNKVYGGLESVGVEEGEQRYSFADGFKGVTEEMLLDFHSPYGCSKGAADQYVRDYARLYDLKTVVLRQSCIYGPHQMGIEDQGWVAWFMIAALFNRPITLYGNGKQVRDLLFVDDLIAAYDACINQIDTVSGQAFNMGGGPDNTLSLLEFLDFLKGDLGMTVDSSFGGVRPGDQPIFVSDNSTFMQATGWEPRVGTKEGIAKLLDWLKENKDKLGQFYE